MRDFERGWKRVVQQVSALLAELRTITQGDAIPASGCEALRRLHRRLAGEMAYLNTHVEYANLLYLTSTKSIVCLFKKKVE